MGNSHFKSNVIGKDGTETIRGFATISASALIGSTSITGAAAGGFATLTATALTVSAAISGATISGTTSITTPKATIDAGGYIQLGAHQYILFGAMTTAASVQADVTAVDASNIGSMYLGTDGQGWLFTAESTAATISVT